MSLATSVLSEQQLSIYDELKGIERDFWRFDRANPQIYRKLVSLARQVKGAGHNRYSIDALFHRLRWHHDVELRSQKGKFKLNDHFTSHYARLIMSREADLIDFFEVRENRGKSEGKA